MIGAYDVLAGNVHGIEKVMSAFKSGGGVDYGSFHPCVFQGTARFFKPSYETNLIQKWIPKFPAVEKILRKGGDYVMLVVLRAFRRFCLHPNIKPQSLGNMMSMSRRLPRQIPK